MMPPRVHEFLEYKVLGLSKLRYSDSVIIKQFTKDGIDITKATTCSIIEGAPQNTEKIHLEKRESNTGKPSTAETSGVLENLERTLILPEQSTQKGIASPLGVPQATVNRAIHEDVAAATRKKIAAST